MNFFTVAVSTHRHSSLIANFPDHLINFFPEREFPEQVGADWKVTFIWKKVGKDPVLILSPLNNQVGIANLSN